MSKRKAEEAPAPKLASIFTKKVKPAEEDNNQKSWKFVCWNVAGLRACVKKSDFKEVLAEEPDLVFLGETKCKEWPPEMEETFKVRNSWKKRDFSHILRPGFIKNMFINTF